METTVISRLAPIFISHGSPALYMETKTESYAFYHNLGKSYLERTPKIEAIVIFSAHWDTSDSVHVTTAAKHNQVIFFFPFYFYLLFIYLLFYHLFCFYVSNYSLLPLLVVN